MSKEQHDAGLAFAVMVRQLARDHAPDLHTEKLTQALARQFDVYYGYTINAKRSMVKIFLRDNGPSSSTEIRDKFQWDKDAVYRLLNSLVNDGEIKATTAKGTGAGRPTVLYSLSASEFARRAVLRSR